MQKKDNSMKKSILILILLLIPTQVYACGQCLDHGIDWFFPFVVPIIPITLLYFLTTQLLQITGKLPKPIQTFDKNLVGMFIIFSIIGWIFITGGLTAILAVASIFALMNYFKSWKNVLRVNIAKQEILFTKILLTIFAFLWLGSLLLTPVWKYSESRMKYHLTYSGGPAIMSSILWYESHPERYRNSVIEEIKNPSFEKGNYRYNFWLSNMFYLARQYQAAEVAPSISSLLITNANTNDIYKDRFYKCGLDALIKLDKPTLITTIKQLLELPRFKGKIEYNDEIIFALILFALIENGKKSDYADYLTLDNLKLLQKYQVIQIREPGLYRKENGGFDTHNIDYPLFGLGSTTNDTSTKHK
jgi:hypothetical protein